MLKIKIRVLPVFALPTFYYSSLLITLVELYRSNNLTFLIAIFPTVLSGAREMIIIRAMIDLNLIK